MCLKVRVNLSVTTNMEVRTRHNGNELEDSPLNLLARKVSI